MPRTTAKKNSIRRVKAAQLLGCPLRRLTVPGLQDMIKNVFGSLFQRMNLLISSEPKPIFSSCCLALSIQTFVARQAFQLENVWLGSQ